MFDQRLQETCILLQQYGDVHVMKIYGWYFKSHDDPQTHPLMRRSRSLYAHCSHTVLSNLTLHRNSAKQIFKAKLVTWVTS